MSDTEKPRGRAIVAAQVEPNRGSNYPDSFRSRVATREKRKLGDVFGLKNFGVNLTTLPSGSQSALRHWHAKQDELIYIVSGELVLVTDAGEETLRPGMAAGFPAGVADAHYLLNRSNADATYVEIGDRTPGDAVTYPDDDIEALMVDGKWTFRRKDGAAY